MERLKTVEALRRLRIGRPAPIWPRLMAQLGRYPEILAKNPSDLSSVAQQLEQLQTFVKGIEAYQNAPIASPPVQKLTLWQCGTTKLRDYTALERLESVQNTANYRINKRSSDRGISDKKTIVFVIPPLINGSEILDLTPQRSFLGGLQRAGFHPLWVDWGDPGVEERFFNIEDYIVKRLQPAYNVAVAMNDGKPPLVVGYCLGGTLAVGLAATLPKPPKALCLIGAPWDFSALSERILLGQSVSSLIASLSLLQHIFGVLPPEFAQTAFAYEDLTQGSQQFARFGHMAQQSTEAQFFIALQDWIHEGPVVSIPLLMDCFKRFYLQKETIEKTWFIQGKHIHPCAIPSPFLLAYGCSDRIVPMASAVAAMDSRTDTQVLAFDCGHIGLVAGGAASRIIGALKSLA